MNNYKNLFNIINTAVKDLHDCFETIKVPKSEKVPMTISTNIITSAFNLEESEDECDFTESMMLENISSQKSNTQLPRNKTKKTKFHITDTCLEKPTLDNDDTLIEYENIRYENPVFIEAKGDIFRANTLSDEGTVMSNRIVIFF